MKINQSQPFLGMAEYEAIKVCFENNWITEGPKSKEFSDRLCKLMGCKYGVFAPNGTLALYLGLRALGIGPGDEVIVPDFTFIASANAVEMVGAKPVFADINRDTLHVDIEECEKLITKHTKAIMPVHIYGAAANMDKIMTFANKYNLKVIEDAAQALGVYWNKKHCGTFGEVGCFSFFADKTITTGEGGFVCTDDEKIYNELIYLRNQGRLNRGSFIHPRIGYNFRITDIQSAIGLVQLDKLEAMNSRRAKIMRRYIDGFSTIPEVDLLLPFEPEKYVYWMFGLRTDQRDDLAIHLKSKGVATGCHYTPMTMQPLFRQFDNGCTTAHEQYSKLITLPFHADLTNEEVDYVIKSTKDFF